MRWWAMLLALDEHSLGCLGGWGKDLTAQIKNRILTNQIESLGILLQLEKYQFDMTLIHILQS